MLLREDMRVIGGDKEEILNEEFFLPIITSLPSKEEEKKVDGFEKREGRAVL